MAMTADSSSNNHSPRGTGISVGDGMNGSPLRRKTLPSAWASVVRGESESISAANHSPSSPSSPSSSPPVTSLPEQTSVCDNSPPKAVPSMPSPPPEVSVVAEGSNVDNDNATRPKKPAWNKPANGVVEVSPVMGAEAWPALSKSSRASTKSLADSSSKATVDGSVSTVQGPLIPHSPQKQAPSNANPSSTSNRPLPSRQRSTKRGGGGGSSSGGGPPPSSFPHPHTLHHPHPPPSPSPPTPPPFPPFHMGPTNFVGAMPDPTLREPPYRAKNWEPRPVGGYMSQPHMTNDHGNSSRRRNFGTRDGPFHNNIMGRREQERGNFMNHRDSHMHPQRAPPRAFLRPLPPNIAPYGPLQPVRPFMNPVMYPEYIYLPPLPLESYRGTPPYIAHHPPPPFTVPIDEEPVSSLIVKQIDYYFSDANLVKDDFLKSNMDAQGWVPITLIASFPRVKRWTNDIQLIVNSLSSSVIVEVQDDKVRRRNEWVRWVPASVRHLTESGSQPAGGSSYDMLATSLENINLEEAATNQSNITSQTAPFSGDLERSISTEQYQLPNGMDTEDTSSLVE